MKFPKGKKKSWDFLMNWAKHSTSSSSSPPSSSSSSSSSINNDKYLLSAIKPSLVLIFLIVCTSLATRLAGHGLIFFAGNPKRFGSSIFYNYYPKQYPKRDEHILNCTSSKTSITCPANYPPNPKLGLEFSSNRTCPEYFRWIHEDLKIWKEKGITRRMVESLEKYKVPLRLIIVNGIAYVKQYDYCPFHRDVFTFWGILQLLKLYPGRLPDLDLMFECRDYTQIKKEEYPGEQSAFAPPLFHYCGDDSTFDVVFPDWSFWGWPELNIKPWGQMVMHMRKGNSMKNWTARKPLAYWKGNLRTGERKKLAKCGSIKDWNAEIIHLDWNRQRRAKYNESDLSKQCLHRYSIYIEGFTWSVSEKYILACDSMTLLVNPAYYEFFTRGLIPMKHYWPINWRNLCKSIKFAVNWGNNNTYEAQKIGKAGSDYIFEQVNIHFVYDYMFHVLNEYAKLLKYKPTVPEGAVQLCSEKFACSPMGKATAYKIEGIVNGPAKEGPCNLPSPYDPNTLQNLRHRNAKIKEVVEMWENGSG